MKTSKDDFYSHDSFGDSLTVQFFGGPFDGEDVIQGEITNRLYLQDPSYLGSYYQWRDGAYHWEVQP